MAELSPLQLIAEAGWGNNTAIAVSSELTLTIDTYLGTQLLAPLANAIANSASANLLSNTVANLCLIASNTCPALGDSPPLAYVSTLGNILSQYGNVNPANIQLAETNFSNIVTTVGGVYLSGNLFRPVNTSIFSQIFQGAQGFVQQNNVYLDALTDVASNVAPTFTNYNNYITGDLARVTLATVEFGQDLEKLGFAINLENLENLGSPAALLAQIVSYGGFNDLLARLLTLQNVPEAVVVDLIDPSYMVTDTINRKIYLTLAAVNTQTTPTALAEILAILRVTTPNINSLADLLNPVKIFPNSFQTLSVPTEQGSTAIYLNSTGAVNTSLITLLPSYVISTVGTS